MSNLRRSQSAFTIIELLLAITFFSFILVMFTFGFVQINRTFTRGQTVKRVTETGRSILEDIARNVRVSEADASTVLSGPVNRLCLSNGVHYGWNVVGQTSDQIGGVPISFVKTQSTHVCNSPFTLGDVEDSGDGIFTQSVTSLMDEDMVVQSLDFQRLPDKDFMRIDLTISTGELDATGITGDGTADAQCTGFRNNGDQFCDVVRFSTIVNFRID